MREKRAVDPGAAMGTWLPPVDMPVQTYQWNKRGVVEALPDADAPGGAPTDGSVAPPSPPPVPVMPIATDTWAAAPAPRTQVVQSTVAPTHSGIAFACVIALAMPFGLAFAVEGFAWRHSSGTNSVLVALVAATVFVGSLLIGLLSSEMGLHRSIGRGLIAGTLAGVTTVLLALTVDAHPVKFGFDLGPSVLVALLGPLLAFGVASGIGSRR